jgi:iron complex transport system substrate-binding protein
MAKQNKSPFSIWFIVIILIGTAFAGGYVISQQVSPDTNENDNGTTVTVQDSADRYVEIPHPVKSIVVLWDNPTEEIKALGAIDRIVGIDTATKDWVDQGIYPELKETPVIGSWDEPNYEKIAELDPDVVIMLSSYPPLPDEVQTQLDPFGIAVVGLDFYRTEVYIREVKTLGFMLDLETVADNYIDFFKVKFDLISSRISEIPDEERKSVYFEGAEEYQTYGGADYGAGVPGMIRASGGIDLYPEISAYAFEADPEDIAQREPDVIIKGQYEGYFLKDKSQFISVYNSITSRSELTQSKAVTKGEVYVISFDVTGGARKKFGPMFLAKILYPDKFTDFDPETVLKEYFETYLDLTWQGEYVYPEI